MRCSESVLGFVGLLLVPLAFYLGLWVLIWKDEES
jgi:hypothetical protein